MTRYLQDNAKQWKGMSRWEAQLEANRIGIAFWGTSAGTGGQCRGSRREHHPLPRRRSLACAPGRYA
jgi:hypothetical protein